MNIRKFNPSERRANRFADKNSILFFLSLANVQTLRHIGKFISSIRVAVQVAI